MVWLKNVRLEIGNSVYRDGSLKTQTELFDIELDKKRQFSAIIPVSQRPENRIGRDMQGWLMLPAFKEMHNHLDKTYLSQGWKASLPVNSLKERLGLEAEELKELAGTVEQRASAMIQWHLKNGVNHIRTHVNIDPYIGLINLEGVVKALARYEGMLTAEIVAFPQHGLLDHPEMPGLLRRALESGATMLGALDPGGIDGHIESSLEKILEIALDYQVDVDFHLHDRGYLGYYTMDKWLELVDREKYRGKTSFSHAFGLADLPEATQIKFAAKLARDSVRVMTTVPIKRGNRLIPIEILDREGVQVSFGCDGFFDSWSPYGSGDVLEKVRNYCSYRSIMDEECLRDALKYITNGLTPLSRAGQHQWPKLGDEASAVFLPVSCSAEAVARVPKERLLMNQGRFFE
ncbi:amidohydrolase [Vagococcus sp.]|uniref:amidohydrolase n=1 Tax=Vagococcus sp. TaxID=1933889 RepID=UPI003F9903B3